MITQVVTAILVLLVLVAPVAVPERHVVGGGSSTNSYSMTGNWVMGANGWTFVKSDGKLATNTWGWINGQYYYFDANGNMMTGWQFIQWQVVLPEPGRGKLTGRYALRRNL